MAAHTGPMAVYTNVSHMGILAFAVRIYPFILHAFIVWAFSFFIDASLALL